ncbi:hypothetical protein OIU79_020211 [Salix purpurea]|uniref:Uncharacterized protein n=1 Tax=Salix purpurea TaxID=77065 RepID=A0A9Q0P309_SALPP|nr:hypothetical protein OIU79_020211 [Salix purpurea]
MHGISQQRLLIIPLLRAFIENNIKIQLQKSWGSKCNNIYFEVEPLPRR